MCATCLTFFMLDVYGSSRYVTFSVSFYSGSSNFGSSLLRGHCLIVFIYF
jgi:hypothetical protein